MGLKLKNIGSTSLANTSPSRKKFNKSAVVALLMDAWGLLYAENYVPDLIFQEDF